MRILLILTTVVGLVCGAYFNAQSKIQKQINVSSLRLGMTLAQVEEAFGTPTAQIRHQLTYILEDSSELTITLREDLVASAKMKYHQPLKIGDTELRQLSLVQMESDGMNSDRPSWFFAGKPSEGLIYKITAEGAIESLTWVPPFTYGHNQPKQLQALLQDFRNQQSANL